MACVVLFILFGLNCVFFPSKGQIILPPGGNSLIVLNGSTVKIEWSLNSTVDTTANIYRFWNFKSARGSKDEFLGEISRSGTIEIFTKLYDVAIEVPATLVLKNVNASYDGRYEFTLASPGTKISNVDVVIAVKPNPMIINCSDPTTVNEGDDLACVCRDKEGKPQANLTWYDKDGVQIGGTSYGENILTLTNVTKQDSGRYTCEAQSYTLVDDVSFQLIVRPNYKPNKTEVTIINPPAVVGKSVTVMCKSNGRPEPSYTIMHNDSITVSDQSTYFINKVKWNDTGRYKCIARNKLGSDSASKNLTVTEQGQTTKPPTASTSTTGKGGNGTVSTKPPPTKKKKKLSTGAIVGIIIGVLLLIIIIVVVVVYCCKSKEKERSNSCANIDPVPGNGHELEEPGPSDGAYDTVWTSGSKSKAPVENALPPVYAAVDKNNRQGNTLYASLDNKALQSSRASKKEPDRPQQTEYASIDFAKTGNAPKTV